ncbi:hypothetical protein [Roseobacter sp. MH60115]|nr:hypothetical protein [Roseobacter sp. MH60115]
MTTLGTTLKRMSAPKTCSIVYRRCGEGRLAADSVEKQRVAGAERRALN